MTICSLYVFFFVEVFHSLCFQWIPNVPTLLAWPSSGWTQLANEKRFLNYWPCTWVFAAHRVISCCPFLTLALLLGKISSLQIVQKLIWLFLTYETRLPEALHLFSRSHWYGGLTLDSNLIFWPKPLENVPYLPIFKLGINF